VFSFCYQWKCAAVPNDQCIGITDIRCVRWSGVRMIKMHFRHSTMQLYCASWHKSVTTRVETAPSHAFMGGTTPLSALYSQLTAAWKAKRSNKTTSDLFTQNWSVCSELLVADGTYSVFTRLRYHFTRPVLHRAQLSTSCRTAHARCLVTLILYPRTSRCYYIGLLAPYHGR